VDDALPVRRRQGINERYSTLANGATTFASALEQTDQTIRYS
jgi:hypothetical protein